MGTYNKINLLLPTRDRVKNGKLEKCIYAILDTADDINNVCITYLVHDCDYDTKEYLLNNCKCRIFIVSDNYNEPNFAKMYNLLYKKTAFNEDTIIVGMIEDDMIFKTQGWDTKIIDKMNEIQGKGIIYCNDDFQQHEKLCVNHFVTREFVRATGKDYMWDCDPPQWIDHVWMEVGKAFGCLHYLPDVIIKHEHFTVMGGHDECSKKLINVKAVSGIDKAPAYGEEVAINLRKYYGSS